MSHYFDIHTHQHTHHAIVNCMVGADTPDHYFSIGIHPWYIPGNVENALHLLKTQATDSNCLAIGECGLDRFSKSSLKIQEDVFIAQLQIAEQLNKPLIIHLVKAYEEFIKIIKTHRPHVPIVIHGFNKHPQLLEQLKQLGCYFSFGKALFDEHNPAKESLKLLTPNQFFLETDDSAFTIAQVYLQAALLRNEDSELMAEKIKSTIQQVFHARF